MHSMMTTRRPRPAITVACWVLAAVAGAAAVGDQTLHAQDSTQPLLGAVRIDNTLWIQPTPAGLDFAVNDIPREFLPLIPGTTMVAPGYVKVVWKRLNPLAVAVTASETESTDPNFAALSQFLDTLAKLPDLISKPQSGSVADCPGIRDVNVALSNLQNALNVSSTLGGNLVTWRQDIAQSPGPGSIAAVQEKMSTAVATIRRNVGIARDQVQALQRIASTAPPAPAASVPPASGGSPGSGTGHPIAPSQPTIPVPGAPPAAGAQPASGLNCADAAVIARLIALTAGVTDVAARIDLLERLAGDLEKLGASLDVYVKGNWIGDSFEFYRTTANPKVIKAITIKAVPVGVRFVSGGLVRTLDTDKTTSVTFNLRQHSAVVVEVAPGFVVTKVTAPQYETGIVDGKTVVVRGKDKEVSYGGALLLNAILGSSRQSVFYPMIQTGVSVSPDGPGVLLGVGGRFTRARALAFSVGGILGWVKDLQTLAPGSPVASKADIKADLGYEPTVRWYFALQYNFK
jgi:hypothetical protein